MGGPNLNNQSAASPVQESAQPNYTPNPLSGSTQYQPSMDWLALVTSLAGLGANIAGVATNKGAVGNNLTSMGVQMQEASDKRGEKQFKQGQDEKKSKALFDYINKSDMPAELKAGAQELANQGEWEAVRSMGYQWAAQKAQDERYRATTDKSMAAQATSAANTAGRQAVQVEREIDKNAATKFRQFMSGADVDTLKDNSKMRARINTAVSQKLLPSTYSSAKKQRELISNLRDAQQDKYEIPGVSRIPLAGSVVNGLANWMFPNYSQEKPEDRLTNMLMPGPEKERQDLSAQREALREIEAAKQEEAQSILRSNPRLRKFAAPKSKPKGSQQSARQPQSGPVKPAIVSQKDWDAATPREKEILSKKLGK